MIRRHPDAASFLARAETWLSANEAANNLVYGVARGIAKRRSTRAVPAPYFATLEPGGRVAGCAMRTPPYGLVLTDGPIEAVSDLAADLLARGDVLPSVHGPEPIVSPFVALWSARTASVAGAPSRQRLHACQAVTEPHAPPPPGVARAARGDEIERLSEWALAFGRETHTERAGFDPTPLLVERIGRGAVCVWEHEGVASMAAHWGRTPRGARVSSVYTPPERRGRGYATATVRHLTRELLAGGLAHVCLYTDLANPTSNRIYRRIGYRPIIDVIEVQLRKRA